MRFKVFIKRVIKYYIKSITGIFRSLFPKVTYCTFFVPRIGHKQFIRIEKTWLGQTLEDEVFELADTADKKDYLDEMLKMGEITQEEYEKFLSPIKK